MGSSGFTAENVLEATKQVISRYPEAETLASSYMGFLYGLSIWALLITQYPAEPTLALVETNYPEANYPEANYPDDNPRKKHDVYVVPRSSFRVVPPIFECSSA
jgi:hypothetical protein